MSTKKSSCVIISVVWASRVFDPKPYNRLRFCPTYSKSTNLVSQLRTMSS